MSNSKIEIGIGEMITIIVGFIIGLGIFRAMYFYSSFGINVLPFMDITEVITLSFDKIFFTAILILGFGLVVVGSSHLLIESSLIDRLKKISDSARQKIVRILWEIFGFLVFMICAFVPVIIFILIMEKMTWGVRFRGFSLMVLIVSFGIVVALSLKWKSWGMTNRIGAVAGFAFIMTVYVQIMAWEDVFAVKNIKNNSSVSVEFDDGHILKSDSISYFIGQTNHYLFFYNEKTRTSEVYKMDNIDKIVFKN